MNRSDRLTRLEGLLVRNTKGADYRMPLAFILVASLRPAPDPIDSIATNLARALDIGGPADLRRALRDDPASVMVAARARLAEMMQARGAVVPDLPTDADLHRHLDVLEEMFADIPEGFRNRIPFACAADWFL